MTTPDRATRRRRYLAAGFVISLLVNAFLIGALATGYLREGHHHRRGPRMVQFELRSLAGRLPPEGMEKVEQAVADTRARTDAHIDRLRELRREIGKLTAAPMPDRAAIDARLAEIRSEIDAMLAEVQKASVDALLALPPDMRKDLADDRNRPPDRH